MQEFDKLKELIASVEPEVLKFEEKGNKSAGTRVRGVMQEIKKLAQDIRIKVQDQKKAGK